METIIGSNNVYSNNVYSNNVYSNNVYSNKINSSKVGLLYSFCVDNQHYLKMLSYAFVAVLLLSGMVQSFVLNLLVFAYLIPKTVEMLKKPMVSNDDENMKRISIMLKYWVCFATLTILESFLNIFSFLPLFWVVSLLKIVGLVMMLQSDNNLLMFYDVICLTIYYNYNVYFTQLINYLEKQSNEFKKTIPDSDKSNGISYWYLTYSGLVGLFNKKPVNTKKED